jgi:hypothetical protein
VRQLDFFDCRRPLHVVSGQMGQPCSSARPSQHEDGTYKAVDK